MSKLKSFDPGAFLTELATKNNPLALSAVGDLIQTFLTSQKKIGARQFSERTNISRQRLKLIMGGDEPTEAENDAICSVFASISERYEMQHRKKATAA